MKIQFKYLHGLRSAIDDLIEVRVKFEVISAQNTVIVNEDEIGEDLSSWLRTGLKCKVDCQYDPNF